MHRAYYNLFSFGRHLPVYYVNTTEYAKYNLKLRVFVYTIPCYFFSHHIAYR